MVLFCFFFKQKTAYEMRISDWSSDVCSSDLPRQGGFTGTYRLLVRGKNINQNTLLATDYLNHFNEIIMLLEMVPSMPECYRDAVEWRPKSYAQHFRDS